VTDTTTGTTSLNYDFSVDINPIGSWADISTMIYIDQPIGTGFSYSEPTEYLTNMTEYTTEWIQMMKNLYIKYPEF
jgi:carboxypeptidase D